MAVLNSRGKERRPKFLLEFSINELINIPQSTGSCQVQWHLKDGTGLSGHKLPAVENRNVTTFGRITSGAGGSSLVTYQNVSTVGKGETQKVEVKQHKASWCYGLFNPIQVKLHVDKSGDLMEKKLEFRVMYETEATYQRHSDKLSLGVVCLNIVDYVREDELAVTNRFLLTDSRINSLLSISIQMKLTRGSYKEFNLPQTNFGSNQIPGTFHTNISDILEDVVDISSPTASFFKGTALISPSPSPSPSPIVSSRPPPLSLDNLIEISGNSNIQKSLNTPGHITVRAMVPLIENLHQKSFQIPWDPRPTEFSTRECIDDIIRGGNGWAKNAEGISFIDIQALELTELEVRYYDTQKDLLKKGYNNDQDEADICNSNLDILATLPTYTTNRREFLERKLKWRAISDTINNAGQDFTGIDFGLTRIETALSNEHATDIMRDAKSWSVSNKFHE